MESPFGMTTDINGKPIPRWQERLEQMYTAYVPFGEILSLVRYLLEERDIQAILSAPDDVILQGFTEEDAAEMRAQFDGVARLVKTNEALLAVCEAFVAAYDAEAWPIENDIGLFVDARAAIAKARGGPS